MPLHVCRRHISNSYFLYIFILQEDPVNIWFCNLKVLFFFLLCLSWKILLALGQFDESGSGSNTLKEVMIFEEELLLSRYHEFVFSYQLKIHTHHCCHILTVEEYMSTPASPAFHLSFDRIFPFVMTDTSQKLQLSDVLWIYSMTFPDSHLSSSPDLVFSSSLIFSTFFQWTILLLIVSIEVTVLHNILLLKVGFLGVIPICGRVKRTSDFNIFGTKLSCSFPWLIKMSHWCMNLNMTMNRHLSCYAWIQGNT